MAEATTWEIVQVDLIGTWKVKTPSGVKLQDALQPAIQLHHSQKCVK
jgi:hypothetical protein